MALALAKSHVFADGNERIAFLSMLVSLRKNGVRYDPVDGHELRA
jgi:prophage maintenance system killer protein